MFARRDVALEMLVDDEEVHEAGISGLGQHEPGDDDRRVDDEAPDQRHLRDLAQPPLACQPCQSDRAAQKQCDRAFGEGAQREHRGGDQHPSARRRLRKRILTRCGVERGERSGQKKRQCGIQRRESRKAEKQRTQREHECGEESRRSTEHRLGQCGGDHDLPDTEQRGGQSHREFIDPEDLNCGRLGPIDQRRFFEI